MPSSYQGRAEQKRDKKIALRVSEADRDKLQQAAEQRAISVSRMLLEPWLSPRSRKGAKRQADDAGAVGQSAAGGVSGEGHASESRAAASALECARGVHETEAQRVIGRSFAAALDGGDSGSASSELHASVEGLIALPDECSDCIGSEPIGAEGEVSGREAPAFEPAPERSAEPVKSEAVAASSSRVKRASKASKSTVLPGQLSVFGEVA